MPKGVFFVSQTGCLLPILILFNLFFGWMFFRPLVWLAIEGVLALLFILNSYFLAKRVSSFAPRRGRVVDAEGEIVEDGKKEVLKNGWF